jgi:Domain of unknown function (DUF5753)
MRGGDSIPRAAARGTAVGIETGIDTNTRPDDIEKILDILEAPQTIRQQVLGDLGHALAIAQRRRLSADLQFNWPLERERNADMVRIFSFHYVPALLQTLEFRQAMLKRLEMSDIELRLAMNITLKRQDRLWDKQRRFAFIMHEATLYTAPGDHALQVAQLDRIEQFIGVRNIKIGIIPLEAGLVPGAEYSPFIIYDNRCLNKVVSNFEIESDDPREIAEHLKIFAELERRADYGDSARALIRKAIDYFS